MPKFEPKQIQKELDQGQLWPVYWIYGTERMKAREIVKRIRKTALGDSSGAASFNEETLDATEVNASAVLDAARSLALGGGLRFVVVREAHALKDSEDLLPLLGPKVTADQLTSVCVFVSKDLDGRKKFSKVLLEQAAVVPCEAVGESERDAWIQYLCKRRGLTLPPELLAQLASLDPWSLDIIEQELEKYSLAGSGEVLLESAGRAGMTERFMNAFFMRNLKPALESVEAFADHPDEALPLLGLLAWNVRHLALVLSAREHGSPPAKLNSFVADRLQAWSRHWSLAEILELQQSLEDLDFSMKQRPLLSLGLWSELVMRFCQYSKKEKGPRS